MTKTAIPAVYALTKTERRRALRTFKKARKLLSDPKRWTQGAMARDSFGQNVAAHSSDAVCWCATGAIHAAASGNSWDIAAADWVLRDYLTLPSCGSIVRFNDRKTRTHEQVLAVFDKAITRLEEVAA